MDEGIAVIGVGRTPYGRDFRSIPEMVYEAVSRAIAEAGVTREEIDYAVSAGLDIFDGKIASNVMIVEVTGAVLKEEVRIADEGIAALFHAAALLASGFKRTALVVACCKHSESDPDRVSEWFVDPVFMQPLGLNDLYAAALQADLWLRQGGSALEASALVSARRGIPVEEVEGSPYLCRPIRALWRAPLCDGACAVVLSRSRGARDVGRVSLVGAGLCVEPHYLGDRDLLGCPALVKAAKQALGQAQVNPEEIELAEISAPFAHQEIIWRNVLGLSEGCRVNPSGGWFADAGNPYLVAGLERVIQAVEALRSGVAHIALAHGAWGPAGQGQAVVILRREPGGGQAG